MNRFSGRIIERSPAAVGYPSTPIVETPLKRTNEVSEILQILHHNHRKEG